ncbi:hypothetical protein [Prochlorococcus marinus]|uniref:hypothetical protein n=1 Tax=Prochlorococcus marinus TaxID=1219 RepID=UPI0022B48257|nr:hypothetical protein [Prochlorococcus marinus]
MSSNKWLEESEASKELGVSEKTLKYWREVGYLKAGTHWRSAPDSNSKPWNPIVIYRLNWCMEIIEYWRSRDVPMNDLAA